MSDNVSLISSGKMVIAQKFAERAAQLMGGEQQSELGVLDDGTPWSDSYYVKDAETLARHAGKSLAKVNGDLGTPKAFASNRPLCFQTALFVQDDGGSGPAPVWEIGNDILDEDQEQEGWTGTWMEEMNKCVGRFVAENLGYDPERLMVIGFEAPAPYEWWGVWRVQLPDGSIVFVESCT